MHFAYFHCYLFVLDHDNNLMHYRMAADLSLSEKDINVLVKEYLSFVGLEKTLYSLQLECTEKGKPISTGNEVQRDGSKLTAQVCYTYLKSEHKRMKINIEWNVTVINVSS